MASPSEDTTTACLIDGTLLTNRSMSQLRLAAPLLTCRSFHLDRSSRSRRRAAVQPPLDLAGTPPGRSGSLPRPGPTRSNWSATRDPTGTTIRADEWEDWAFHPIRHRPGAGLASAGATRGGGGGAGGGAGRCTGSWLAGRRRLGGIDALLGTVVSLSVAVSGSSSAGRRPSFLASMVVSSRVRGMVTRTV